MVQFRYLRTIFSVHIVLYLMPTSIKGQSCPTHGFYNITQFGESCQYRCRCINDEQCHRLAGSCTNGCALGWMGPGCQYRNVASLNNGTAMFNGTSEGSQLAVDGQVTSCSRLFTDGEVDPWWQIDFPRLYYIPGLVLKSDRQLDIDFRVEGSSDFDSDITTSCYINQNSSLPREVEIMCLEPMLVQQIRIIASASSNMFSLCEVELFGGRYVSYKGSVIQSSSFPFWPMSVAAAAVDGRPMLDGDEQEAGAQRTCFVSNLNSHAEYWKLVFSKDMILQAIYVYGRMLQDNQEYISQIEGFSLHAMSTDEQEPLLYTDSTVGNNWTDYQPRMVELDMPILSGGVVIYSNPQTVNHLSLCEVEVFAECDKGKCGWDCADVCHCNIDTSGSYRKNGKCPYGCMHRWMGLNDRCDNTCPDNTWGPNCTLVCYCSPGSQCDIHNGTCPGECDVGWKGQACNKTCDNNMFGQNCGESCGACLDNAQCNVTNGHCPGLCTAGLKGIFCNETCRDGFYGVSCTSSCGVCLNSEVCIKTTGWCPSGCDPGYARPLCDGVCTGKKYGNECHETCGNCKDDVKCNYVNGHCPAGCQPGWRGLLCKDVCADFFYGQDCNNSCGSCIDGSMCNKHTGECQAGCEAGKAVPLCKLNCAPYTYGTHCQGRCGVCKDNHPCNPLSGYCEDGCEPGYDGDTCEGSKEDSEDDFNKLIYLIWGIAASVLCLVIVIALLITCMRRNVPSRESGFNDTHEFVYQDPGGGTAESEFYSAIGPEESSQNGKD